MPEMPGDGKVGVSVVRIKRWHTHRLHDRPLSEDPKERHGHAIEPDYWNHRHAANPYIGEVIEWGEEEGGEMAGKTETGGSTHNG